MIFSSVTFLFLFLPLVLAGTFFAGKKYRNHVLFAASLLFYLWGEGVYLLLLLSSILATFYIGRRLEKSSGAGQKMLLALGILINLLPLFIFKYLHFTLDALTPIFVFAGTEPWQTGAIHLPAGISFFTFQAISYLIDVYRRVAPAEQRLLNCGLYISMFPQLIAGPIVRYHDIAKQLVRRTVSIRGFAGGAERFVFGLSKKVLLADPLGVKADDIFNLPLQELSMGDAWLGAICFTLQIYYDFSGYSDMAIGLGKMFGFNLPENFRYPYISRSIREFWRRWHISLSTWLRDYLYIPLGGSRKGTGRTLANLLIVFLLCGLWHGASWTFIVWGLWHGIFLVLERLVPLRQNSVFLQGMGWLYTTLVVIIGWVIFRSPSMEAGWQFIQIMAGSQGMINHTFFLSPAADRLLTTQLITGLLLALPVYGLLRRLADKVQQWSVPVFGSLPAMSTVALGRLTLFGTLLYFVLISIAAQAYHPFLYFQF
ncbi:MAG: MBOAT family protein [Thermodesulfobacteriota bacterium]|nr:MBOAT family protein [Thermodesulfobacteriota bacterium]